MFAFTVNLEGLAVPESKYILVLANSIKHWPGVCIAGREIESSASNYTIGPWLRPVSLHGEGELSHGECCLTNGRQPKVMDFVQLTVGRKMTDPLQPENWSNDNSVKWKSVNSSFQRPSFDLLVESPKSLWIEPDGRIDRVSADHLKGKRLKASLRLIHVPEIEARFEWNEWDGRFKQRRRALFTYNGISYELNITDPAFSDRYRANFPAQGSPSKTFSVKPLSGCHLCVSLAPEFNGYHYKVVATIIEKDE